MSLESFYKFFESSKDSPRLWFGLSFILLMKSTSIMSFDVDYSVAFMYITDISVHCLCRG